MLKTDYFTFISVDNKIKLRVGDLHDFSDYMILDTDAEIIKGGNINVIASYGFKKIANTLKDRVMVKTAKEAPLWIYQEDEHYSVGLLIPPYVET